MSWCPGLNVGKDAGGSNTRPTCTYARRHACMQKMHACTHAWKRNGRNGTEPDELRGEAVWVGVKDFQQVLLHVLEDEVEFAAPPKRVFEQHDVALLQQAEDLDLAQRRLANHFIVYIGNVNVTGICIRKGICTRKGFVYFFNIPTGAMLRYQVTNIRSNSSARKYEHVTDTNLRFL